MPSAGAASLRRLPLRELAPCAAGLVDPLPPPPRLQRLSLLTVGLLAVTLTAARPASASIHSSVSPLIQSATPPVSHSHYVTGYYPSTYKTMGVTDGKYDAAHCVTGTGDNRGAAKITILDYGQPRRLSTTETRFQGYGTNTVSTGIKLYDYQIQDVTQQYALGYYGGLGTSRCPVLRLMVGTNNSQICGQPPGIPGDPGCTRTGAGNTWADLTVALDEWAIAQGYHANIEVGAASDEETNSDKYASGNYQWNDAASTNDWVNGYHQNNLGSRLLFDYGDAVTSPGRWTITDVYRISYNENTENYAFPEIYNPGGTCNWSGHTTFNYTCRSFSAEGSNSTMFFPGELTECGGVGDVPPGNYPSTQCRGPAGDPQFGPAQAWNDLHAVQSRYWGQTTLDYSSDI